MKIEAGKFYKARDGSVFGPIMRKLGGGFYPWTVSDLSRDWRELGGYVSDFVQDGNDLIEEVPAPSDKPSGPVRTVTRKEIVSGKYGPCGSLDVKHYGKDGNIYVGLDGTVLYTADEVRMFARLLTEIADAMEDQAK